MKTKRYFTFFRCECDNKHFSHAATFEVDVKKEGVEICGVLLREKSVARLHRLLGKFLLRELMKKKK